MLKKDALQSRSRAHEEKFFRERDAQLIEKKKLEEKRAGLKNLFAEKLGLDDHAVLDALAELGFDAETVGLVRLLPLLAVAWADGEISGKERAAILAAARIRDIAEGSPADELLAGWLRKSPDPAFFEKGLAAASAVLKLLPEGKRRSAGGDLVSACEAVARASGGFLGLGTVSAEEKAILDAVAREVEAAHREAARRLANEL